MWKVKLLKSNNNYVVARFSSPESITASISRNIARTKRKVQRIKFIEINSNNPNTYYCIFHINNRILAYMSKFIDFILTASN